jgi:hypothetical protein
MCLRCSKGFVVCLYWSVGRHGQYFLERPDNSMISSYPRMIVSNFLISYHVRFKGLFLK